MNNMVNRVKARTRSIQFDKNILGESMAMTGNQPKPNKRTSSLVLGQENAEPASPSTQPSAAVRRYKSMLEVEDPPKIEAAEPMSFDELYAEPIKTPPPAQLKAEKSRPTRARGTETASESEANHSKENTSHTKEKTDESTSLRRPAFATNIYISSRK